MKYAHAALAAALSIVAATAMASDIHKEWSTGFDFGGDNLLTAVYTTGETTTINAGDGFYIKGGFSTPIGMMDKLELAALLGWKYTAVNATNGDASLSRFPLDVSLRYNLGKHRISAGFTRDNAISFSSSGVLSGAGMNLNSKLGETLQYEYVLFKGMALGVRYTSLSYEAPDSNTTYDASSIGMVLGGAF